MPLFSGDRIVNIFRNISEISLDRPVATIGIFDGVHLAHKAIIDELKLRAYQVSGQTIIITLWPHPRIVLNNDTDKVKLLNTMDEKIEHLKKAGVENLLILPFDKNFASTGFEDFIREILVEKIGVSELVVGYNHQFGKNREGNFTKLQVLSDRYGFNLVQLNPVLIDNEKVSSSVIRKLLNRGNVALANKLLGYYYYIRGKVVSGYKVGRNIGYPTANLKVEDGDKLIPANGVYAVLVRANGSEYKGMMNIGFRPTLHNENHLSVMEVHLFDYKGDLYREELKVRFIEWIRQEQKFESVDELKKQITGDEEKARKILESAKMNYL
ncbi:MAG: bifunctional riboflavin kinase/FAD synthetase [Bacteroidales bacterium]|nr:bifunctional riboflavin kinase/FAD synthetase [Bacteroidales bacterium]